MSRRITELRITAIATAWLLGSWIWGSVPARLSAQEAAQYSTQQKQSIEQIIKEYFLGHPELMIEIQSALEAKLETQQAERLKMAVSQNARDLFRNPATPVIGNPDGDITIVEFFDYNCPYCKKIADQLGQITAADPKLRIAFKEMPILSKGSDEASRVALAAKLQGKYWEVHRALLLAPVPLNEVSALKIAERSGLDMAKLKRDMTGEPVNAELRGVRALAATLGVNGTPHFIVGDRAISGAPPDLSQLLAAHADDMRKSQCAYC